MTKKSLKTLESRPTFLAALAKAAQGSETAAMVATVLVCGNPGYIALMRKMMHWSQRDFAKATGLTKHQAIVSKWETGDAVDIATARNAINAYLNELKKPVN